jgi:ABC-type transport system involved in cytochrome bd biosynthesis fused ATPase/permease subunit
MEEPDASGSTLLRPVAPGLLLLALFELGSVGAVPLALVAFDTAVPWYVPLGLGLVTGLLRFPLERALRRALRPRLFAYGVAVALGRPRAVAEALTDAFLWSMHRAEHAIVHSAPLALAAALTTLGTAVAAAQRVGATPAALVTIVIVLALAVRLGTRRSLRPLEEAERAARERIAATLAAAARDDGELARGTPRLHLLERARDTGRGWAEAEVRVEARSRALRRAILATSAVVLVAGLAVSTELDLAWLARFPPPTTPTRALRDLLVLLSVAPAALLTARALDELAGAHQMVRALGPLARPRSGLRTTIEGADQTASLEVSSLTVRYGEHVALADVSLSLPLRGVTAIVGPNGAGKSTLARALVGYVVGCAGEVRVGAQPVTELHPDVLALVPQQPVLVESLTVAENVRLVAADASDAEIDAALARVGSRAPRGHLAGALSRGEQRRIAIARATLRDPLLLVLDEPDAWLDRAGREAVARVLREEGAKRAVVVVTHRADLVRWVDRVVVLRSDHTVEAVGPPDALGHAPTFAALVRDAADEALQLGAELRGPREVEAAVDPTLAGR